ncbi:hypothetical protein [Catenibacterium mitsuokai]|uniref:hypothetical protein n=1 Tax=Catenibacterium mitsuokai TaxID=100886 RepID=UPI0018A98FF5|nr:hypothetical protein [Catenibacterium mitsuokai]
MENKRIQAQFLVTSTLDDIPQLILEKDALLIKNESDEDITIPFSSIDSIKILPVNRIYNPSVGLLKDGFKGFMAHRNAGVFSIYFNYFVDLNVYTNKGNYFFESLDLENASKFILKLNNLFKIKDDVNLIDLFKTKSINEIKDYMDKHYKDLAKTYNLENPRTTLDESMVRLAKKK